MRSRLATPYCNEGGPCPPYRGVPPRVLLANNINSFATAPMVLIFSFSGDDLHAELYADYHAVFPVQVPEPDDDAVAVSQQPGVEPDDDAVAVSQQPGVEPDDDAVAVSQQPDAAVAGQLLLEPVLPPPDAAVAGQLLLEPELPPPGAAAEAGQLLLEPVQ